MKLMTAGSKNDEVAQRFKMVRDGTFIGDWCVEHFIGKLCVELGF